MKFYILWVSALLLFGGCSTKSYEKSESRLITLKMKELRFSDMGFVRNSDHSVEVELFEAGAAVFNMQINHLICVSDHGCMSRSKFNERYLNSSYPEEMIQNIFLSKPIFDALHISKTDGGFSQKISSDHYDISYEVSSDQSSFRDKRNSILIKIKNLK